MGTPAKIFEALIAMSRVAQADIATQSGDSNLVSFRKLNNQLHVPQLMVEDDRGEIGGGTEFAQNAYLSHWNPIDIPLEKYLTSEWAALCFAFALGKVTTTTPAAGVYQHVIVPRDPATDGIELPYLTYVERVRASTEAVHSYSHIGAVMKSLKLSLTSGVGRGAAKLTGTLMASGRYASPDGVTSFPSVLAENALPAGSATLTILSENPITLKTFRSIELDFDNQVDSESAFFPGSGAQGNASVAGRMEYGDRSQALKANIVVRVNKDSTEFTKLKDLTTGTMTLTVQGGLIATGHNHTLTIVGQKVRYGSPIEVGESNRTLELRLPVEFMRHASNGTLTVTVKNAMATVG
jgi:hypothetical protein